MSSHDRDTYDILSRLAISQIFNITICPSKTHTHDYVVSNHIDSDISYYFLTLSGHNYLGAMSETSRDMATAVENSNIGPDFFGFYTSEVAELLSQDDDFMPSSPQISGLAGNLLVLDREKGTSRSSCTKKENNSISGSASLYSNGIGSLLPEIKKERLKSLLCQSVLTLGQEVNEVHIC